ncbi:MULTISPECIES: flagellin [unclassified Paludibacterium]|uniref:flagellin N-terminal helical domain-containing protein n=1 Tax=unclassified Paludibacterium TaxID=2618429 RepID=UPI001C04F446|nr:flagellin [Paludibacterium sp. B53371]BEV72210.1 flagellin A [Paludibacterium sp. THUN1379]
MAIYVNTNIASLNAQRNLSGSTESLKTSLQRLSSGLRINSAADDPAGMAVSQSMTTQINGNEQGIRNASDGISLAQTAEGALGQIQNNLQTIRQIAVQAANGTISDTNRSQLQKQVDQLTQEISRIVQTTNFNGTMLLSGGNSITFQIGASGVASNQVVASGLDLTSGINSYATSLTATGTIDITTTAKASAVLSALDADINLISNDRSQLGAVQNRFQAVIANMSNYVQNLKDSRSRIIDTDFASETANLTQQQILQQAGTAVLSQANQVPQAALTLLKGG